MLLGLLPLQNDGEIPKKDFTVYLHSIIKYTCFSVNILKYSATLGDPSLK